MGFSKEIHSLSGSMEFCLMHRSRGNEVGVAFPIAQRFSFDCQGHFAFEDDSKLGAMAMGSHATWRFNFEVHNLKRFTLSKPALNAWKGNISLRKAPDYCRIGFFSHLDHLLKIKSFSAYFWLLQNEAIKPILSSH